MNHSEIATNIKNLSTFLILQNAISCKTKNPTRTRRIFLTDRHGWNYIISYLFIIYWLLLLPFQPFLLPRASQLPEPILLRNVHIYHKDALLSH